MARKIATGLALVVVMTLGVGAGPAWASGTVGPYTKNCTSSQHGVSRSYSTGTTYHVAPGNPSNYPFYNGNTWTVRTLGASVAGGGLWQVSTNGAIDGAGTYAYCQAGIP